MAEVFALFATHPVAVVVSILATAMWATVVWVGRGLMSKLDTATAALVAIPERDPDREPGHPRPDPRANTRRPARRSSRSTTRRAAGSTTRTGN